MAKKRLPRLPGESEEEFQRRRQRERSHLFYHKNLARERKPRPRKEASEKKYNIDPPREGESDADYKRRYDRELKRIQRLIAAGHSEDVRGDGSVSLTAGKPHHNFRGTPEELAPRERQDGETAMEWKARLRRDAVRRSYAKHQGKRTAEARKRHWENPEYNRQRSRAYAKTEAGRASQKRYLDKHPERILKLIEWAWANPERARAAKKKWAEENKDVFLESSRDWRASQSIATPEWADREKIMAFKREAARLTRETGIPYAVDHIVPLRGRKGKLPIVCGLNTQRNLRVITKRENSKKHAKLDHELLEAIWQAERHLYPLPDDQV